MDTSGNLYGTTAPAGLTGQGDGTVFKLTRPQRGKLDRVNPLELWQRHRRADPTGGLIMDTSGNFYGTTVTAGLTVAGRCSS